MEHLKEKRMLFFWNNHEIFTSLFGFSQRCGYNGSISKCTYSKQGKPYPERTNWRPTRRWPLSSGEWPSPARPGNCSNRYIPRTLKRKCTKGQGWTGYIGTLWETYSAKKCANSVILCTKHGSLQKNRALFLIKNNQRTIYAGVWTSTDGAKSKPGTFDCFFDLWWLTLCQRSPSYFKEEKEAGGAGREDGATVVWWLAWMLQSPVHIL